MAIQHYNQESTFTAWLNQLQALYSSDSLTLEMEEWFEEEDKLRGSIKGPFGLHGIMEYYDSDENENYIVVGFNLSGNIYAEIDDGTYGSLQGFRVYKDPVF